MVYLNNLALSQSRLGSQVRVRCSVATSWETGKLVLWQMLYLNLLLQNTWSYINWWLYILWHPRIDHSHVLLIVMHKLVCFELVFVRSLIKSQSHETRSSMKLTGEGNIYDQSTRNWQHWANIHVQWYKLDTLKNLKLHFKILQNISLIVCIKKTTKCVLIFPSQNDLNGALDVGNCKIYFLLDCSWIS